MQNRVCIHSEEMNLLVLGPRYHKGEQTGGVVVLFELFVDELRRNGINFRVVDTNKNNYSSRPLALFLIFTAFMKELFSATHVSLHGTANDYRYIAPLVVFLSRCFRKKTSLRKFAGSFREIYDGLGFVSRKVLEYTLRNSDINFFETKYLVNRFSDLNTETQWFPNVRKKSLLSRKGIFRKRFVFMGHVRREKGILELIEVANRLPDEYQVEIYGQMFDSSLEEKIAHSKAVYKGVVKPEEVAEILTDYDVLVLPTFWKGEGYPGVIIEAFSVGLPVVATALDGIKEIVIHGKNGLLVDTKNKEQLEDAMRSFTVKSYPVFSEKAKASFEQFDSSVVTKKFLEVIVVKSFEKNL